MLCCFSCGMIDFWVAVKQWYEHLLWVLCCWKSKCLLLWGGRSNNDWFYILIIHNSLDFCYLMDENQIWTCCTLIPSCIKVMSIIKDRFVQVEGLEFPKIHSWRTESRLLNRGESVARAEGTWVFSPVGPEEEHQEEQLFSSYLSQHIVVKSSSVK